MSSARIDVYAENPCDVLGRIHVYSPLWLLASVLPITTAWTPVMGVSSVALFLLSLTLLPPGRGRWQSGVVTLGTVSSTVAFAVERANIDIIVFVLAVLVGRLMQWRRAFRLLGYSVVLLAGALKFYPIALLILAVHERLIMFVAICIFSAVAVAGYVAFYARDLARVLPSIPTFPYFNILSFGARNMPYGLAQILPLAGRCCIGASYCTHNRHGPLCHCACPTRNHDGSHPVAQCGRIHIPPDRLCAVAWLLFHCAELGISGYLFSVRPSGA